MFSKIAFASSLLTASVSAQGAGTQKTETHPTMTWQSCTSPSSCTTNNGEVVIDANWRWVHDKNGYTNCYTGNTWNTTICPDNKSCAANCVLDGADYAATYGATTSGNALSLKFVTQSSTKNIGSRLYLMESATKYKLFNLQNNEFSFDVDLSKLPCGLNGALYFVSMDADGGMAKYSTNTAGAKYGTGYCDSQCPRDLKFINGLGNAEGWKPSSNDANAGVGGSGSCCAEMDVWEANSISTAFTPHPCTNSAQHICSGDACGGTYSSTRYAGDCDPDGCDWNAYRMGNTGFYGPGKTVDTTKKFTVVTQFSSSEIKQYYIQNGVKIQQPKSTVSGLTSYNSITSAMCTAQKTAFGDQDVFSQKGGLSGMGTALSNGMVLVMSLWDDHYANMLWLDSSYPVDASTSKPGVARGTCATSSGVPSDVESNAADSTVIYSNIKFGPIGSTY
ncbi:Exoglucanase 1 [Diaporthe eres]|uniref:Glucanase n=1 Tax=Diaporthe eres TaxID=83184 RepID=A0ABR1NSJ7_DIAER